MKKLLFILLCAASLKASSGILLESAITHSSVRDVEYYLNKEQNFSEQTKGRLLELSLKIIRAKEELLNAPMNSTTFYNDLKRFIQGCVISGTGVATGVGTIILYHMEKDSYRQRSAGLIALGGGSVSAGITLYGLYRMASAFFTNDTTKIELQKTRMTEYNNAILVNALLLKKFETAQQN